MVGMSMTWNPYPYALGNPVHYTDPSGESPFTIALGVALAVGIGFGIYNAGREFLKQIVDNLQNGQDPFECIDGNAILDSFIDGFTLGLGIVTVAGGATIGLAGLFAGVFHGSKIGFIVAGVVFGGGLVGAETLKNQIDTILEQGIADDFVDALSELDSLLLLDTAIGGGAGGFLGAGNSAAWFSLLAQAGAYILSGGVGSKYPSYKNEALVLLNTVGLDFFDSLYNPESPADKFAFRFFTGAMAFGIHSILTDDDPVTSPEEKGLLYSSGLSNAILEFIPEPYNIAFSNIANTLLNTLSSLAVK